MIDGIRGRSKSRHMHPEDRVRASQTVVGNHSKDKFEPPEQVAAEEEQAVDTNTANELLATEPGKKPGKLKAWWKKLSKKQKILFGALAAVLLAGLITGAYFLFFTSDPPPPKPVQKQQPAPPAPTTVASNLTGLQVDPSVNDRPTTAIMIENSLDARPQSGLNQAGVVFEAIAEGGITRFISIFQDTEPDYIGPVRSVRPYYLQWALGFDAAVAHAGGSAEALQDIVSWHVKDLNHNSAYFWRVSNRAQPHNLYTSLPKLREYEAAKGFGTARFTPLARKAEAPLATPTARLIDFNISSANFNVHYDYDPATNTYKRSEGGKPHTDEGSGAQISPKVVVALIMPQGKSGIYYTYQTIGSGQVLIFQDGAVTTGTWKKDNNNANFVFAGADGAELKLNPGQTWFTALGEASRVTYAP
jgi:hypothetical protein